MVQIAEGGVPFCSSRKLRVGRGLTVPSVTYSSSPGPLLLVQAYSIYSSAVPLVSLGWAHPDRDIRKVTSDQRAQGLRLALAPTRCWRPSLTSI